MKKKRSLLPVFFALVLILVAGLLLLLSLSQDDSKPVAPKPGPAKPEEPVITVPNKPGPVDPKKRAYVGAFSSAQAPKGYKFARAGSSDKGDLVLFTGKGRDYLTMHVDAARADEPISDRAYFAGLGSQVSARVDRGIPAYLITTRGPNNRIILTYITQRDGRNYTVSIYGSEGQVKQLKKQLLDFVGAVRPRGRPPL